MTLPMNIILYIFCCFVDQTGIRLDVFAKKKKKIYTNTKHVTIISKQCGKQQLHYEKWTFNWIRETEQTNK